MKQIQTPNDFFLKTVGYQKPTNENKFRLLAYSLLLPVEAGVLMYNSLTCEMLLLNNAEANDIYTSEYLYQHWFLVPEQFNDLKFASQVRGLYKMLKPKSNKINSYTILTTTDCNARCFYCYEMGRARIPMSLQTAEKIADFIIRNYKNDFANDKDSKVKLRWFGGEPLYNYKVIYAITQKLSDNCIPFMSHMISNGYLFTEQLVADAKNIWNLKDVQITLDGTEKVYNRTKAYIHVGVNAYERVLNNIDFLLKAHIRVFVRMNIDVHNADDLLKLADILAERFGHSKGFSCYPHSLFEAAGEVAHYRTEERRELVYAKQRELLVLLDKKNLCYYKPVPKSIAVNYCMADNGSSVVVVPTGDIGLCEHFSDSEFFSHLDNPDVKDVNVIKSFRETCDDLDICDDCAYYPQCIRLKKCLEGSLCFPQIKQQRIDELKKSMVVTYEKWKKQQTDSSAEKTESPFDDEDDININC